MRASERHRRDSLYHRHEVRESGDIRGARRPGSHHRGDLWHDTAHDDLLLEQLPRAREHRARGFLNPCPGRVDQPHDRPAFAKSKGAVAKATAGYKEINLRALKLLNPDGILVTCSCSYHVNEAAFAEIVYAAAVDAQAHVTVVEKRMQGRDHPVLLGVPETYYLKCFILRKL